MNLYFPLPSLRAGGIRGEESQEWAERWDKDNGSLAVVA